MKLFLKLFLALGILIAGLYLASPLWLPPILASQLPPGWHLEKLTMSWPGWSGIKVQLFSAKGELPGLNLRIVADDSRLSYAGLATQIDSVSLQVFLTTSNELPSEPFSLDTLSLPILHLSADLPVLNVRQAQLVLHLSDSEQPGSVNAGLPIVFALQGFTLSPDQNDGYHVSSTASIVGQPQVNGQVTIDVTPDDLSAEIRFPADANSPAWLNLALKQSPEANASTSEVLVLFDGDLAGQQWLDDLLSKSTAGKLTHVGGRIEARASFNGADSHVVEHLTLKAGQLQLGLGEDSLLVNANINADRQAGRINLTLPTEATVELLDASGTLNNALMMAIPELNRTNSPTGKMLVKLADNGQMMIDSTDDLQAATGIRYRGNFHLDYVTDITNMKISASQVTAGIDDTRALQDFDLAGSIKLNWTESQPFSYASDVIDLKAKSLNFSSSGQLNISPGLVSFKADGPLAAQLPKLQLKIQTGTPAAPAWIDLQADEIKTEKATVGFTLAGSGPDALLDYTFQGPLTGKNAKVSVFSAANPPSTVVNADDLVMTATLDSLGGVLSSEGNGYLSVVDIKPMGVAAARADLAWRKLNLSELTGDVSAKTLGFKAVIEEDTWTGFDFDLNLNLLPDDALKGAGKFIFAGSPGLPVTFDGNTGTGMWDIAIQKSTVPLSSLRSVLRSAHFELPAEIKLTDGTIDVAGTIEVRDEISARFDLAGSNIGGAMAESSARKASFKFNSGYQQDVFVSGPLDIESMTLAGGIDVANIHMDLDVKNPETIDLSNLSANLFDGQLKLEKLIFANGEIADTSILLSQINLAKLLGFLDVAGLSGTGLIDFVLPAGSAAGNVHISNGTFTSTGPGRLSYSQGAASSTNIGLQALENFQYKKLSGDIAYDSKGPYKIGIRLEGSNPDLYSGYPVVFNLTINGSLPELFEAMFMTGSFDESIMQQIKLQHNNGIK